MINDLRTVPAALDRLVRQLPDHTALIAEDRRFTSTELRDAVYGAAAALIALGVEPADRVAIWSPNTWHWVVACLAIHHAGTAAGTRRRRVRLSLRHRSARHRVRLGDERQRQRSTQGTTAR